MSNFKNSLKILLSHEGGFVDHPDDQGGPTNMGITQATLSDYLKRQASVQDVKVLDPAIAELIYKKYYWDTLKLDEVDSEKLSTVIFDLSVLRGPRSVIKELQDLLDIKPDGIVGPLTLDAINRANELKTCIDLIHLSQTYFVGICSFNRNQISFLNGWMNRAHSLLLYVLDMK